MTVCGLGSKMLLDGVAILAAVGIASTGGSFALRSRLAARIIDLPKIRHDLSLMYVWKSLIVRKDLEEQNVEGESLDANLSLVSFG